MQGWAQLMIWKELSLTRRFNDFAQTAFIPDARYTLSAELFLLIQIHTFV